MSEVFKFSSSSMANMAAVLWNVILCLGILLIGLQDGLGSAMWFMLLGGPIAWAIQYYAIVNTMDVVVDDAGISRRFRGRRFFFVAWGDIHLIQTSTRSFKPINGGKRKTVTCLKFSFVNGPGIRLSLNGGMEISSEIAGFKGLVDLVNQNAAKHGIKVEAGH